MIWSISIISWLSRSPSRAKMRTSPQTLSTMLCLLVLAWWVGRKSSLCWRYRHDWSISSTYKGSQVQWDHDECASPLEQPIQPRKENLPAKKKQEPLMNRFQLLNMDGSEDSVSDDEDIDTSGITLPAGIVAWPYPGPGKHWAPTLLAWLHIAVDLVILLSVSFFKTCLSGRNQSLALRGVPITGMW